jgi:hypothetical protein
MLRDEPLANSFYPLPCTLVHFSNLFDQPTPVSMLQIEQCFEVPVEVIGEISHLDPQLVWGVVA